MLQRSQRNREQEKEAGSVEVFKEALEHRILNEEKTKEIMDKP